MVETQNSNTVMHAGNGPRAGGEPDELLLSRGFLRLMSRGKDAVVRIEQSRQAVGSAERSAVLLAAATACVESGRSGLQAMIIVPDAETVQRVASQHDRSTVRVAALGSTGNVRTEATTVLAASSSAGSEIVVTTPERLIDHIRRENVDISRVSVCVLDPPGDESIGQFSADLHYIYTKFDRQPVTALFVPNAPISGEPPASMDSIEKLMRRPAEVTVSGVPAQPSSSPEPRQEQATMAQKDLPFDPEATAQRLRDIVRRIHEEENPEELVQYKRFIKKHVSVFNRAYFTAYLFKQMAGESGGQEARTSIFVSAGRNRRIHARDLVTLFTSADGVTRDDIGQIKVLDNYSFVELDSSKAGRAIEELNGTELRGRKLTINYAKKK